MSDHLSLYYLAALILVVLQDVVSFNYKIEIKTNKEAFSGYAGKSFIKIFGSEYLKTAVHPLILKKKDDFFQKDSTKTLTITDATNVEDICGVTIRTADDAKWCIDSVEVKNVYRNKNRRFLFGQCIKKSSMTRFLIDKGQWSQWGKWSTCDGTCGTTKNQTRVRRCVYPGTRCINNFCSGDGISRRNCTTLACDKVIGDWGNWDTWSGCTPTTIYETRRRYCNCAKTSCPDRCFGSGIDTRLCPLTEVKWSIWSDWSACGGLCDTNSTQMRRRFCLTSFDKFTCDGPTEDERNCTTPWQSCPTISSNTTEATKSANTTVAAKSSNTTEAAGSSKPCPLVNGPQKDYISRSISLGVLFGLSFLINIVLVAFLVVVLKDFCRKKKDSGEDIDGETHARPVPYDETVYNN